ncbi:hypothetical protein L1987_17789 [Smallanthus sonchifolius]|uniref:Uncharacterized protein n=1 Tax=Smallanthus sonchifolius TaxID=185202 RepID=A0ACB9IZG2_9ASTR|nr:hypothetical protein L1987_17789 [Smallanthus sonchifolius]
MELSPKVVNDIHKRGGTILQTSRGCHDTNKIVDNIQDHGINQVYIIGGDSTKKGAVAIYKEVEKKLRSARIRLKQRYGLAVLRY